MTRNEKNGINGLVYPQLGPERAADTIYEYKGVQTLWRCPIDTLRKHDQEGRLHWPKKRVAIPRLKRSRDEYEGVPLQDIWTDISKIHNQLAELVGYATQKPEALLERIIQHQQQ